jgi:signal peptidase I
MRKFGAAVSGIVLIVLIVGSVAVLRGSVALVETHGNSMSPRITTGDLVIVAERSTYHQGEVVAYHSRDLREVVLHRIKAIHGGHYTFRGDHNDFDDAEQPEAGQLIGREMVHIPGGGVWLDRLEAPRTLALVAFMVVVGGGSAANKRKRRRTRPMAQHARPTTNPRRFAGRSRTSVAVALLATVASLAGIALSGLAWTTPTTQPGSTSSDSGARLTFSYRAEVPRSAAYQGTTVTAPDPLFRSLVHTVELSYAYTGRPGTIRLDAELSSASGWHTRIPLQQTARFDHASTDGQVELDLDDLWHRAAAAAAVIGVPVDEVSVAVVPTVRSAEGGTFAPRLAFALTPTQLRLASENPELEFRDSAGPVVGAARPNGIEIAGMSMNVSALRVAVGGATAVALSVLVIFVLAGGHRSGNESRISPRNYGGLLLEVEPISSPPGRPIVDVTDFAALSKLARRYGVLVMYWTRSHVRTFVVHDDGVTYRYRVDVTPRSAPQPGPTPSAASLSRGRSPGALDEPASQV